MVKEITGVKWHINKFVISNRNQIAVKRESIIYLLFQRVAESANFLPGRINQKKQIGTHEGQQNDGFPHRRHTYGQVWD